MNILKLALITLGLSSVSALFASTQNAPAPQYKLAPINVEGQLQNQAEEEDKTPKEKIKEAIKKAKLANADRMAKKLEKVQLSDKQQSRIEAKVSDQIEKDFDKMFEE